jgi:hypothetical protein
MYEDIAIDQILRKKVAQFKELRERLLIAEILLYFVEKCNLSLL